MRDLLILAIVVFFALIALRRPWVGVLLWTWLSIMNPHRYAWGIAYDAPVAAIAAVSTLLGFLFTKERQSPFQSTPTIIFVLFAAWVTLSWLTGVDVVGDYAQWDKVMKIYFMTFVALMLLDHKQKIIAFVWVTTLSLAILGAKGGLFTIITGGNYLVWGPAGSFIADNNHFALALIMTIPLLHFLQQQLTKAWMRHAMTVIMLLCAAAAVGSHSRGGLLAIVAMGTVLWWRSERKVFMTIAIGLAVLFVLPIMPETWWNRMGTIVDYESDTSAMGRLNAWGVAWEVAKHNFFGGGMSYQHPIFFSLYGVYETTARSAHSIYFQILGNHGFVGLILFLLLWIATYRSAGWLRKSGQINSGVRWVGQLGAMAQVSLVGYAVGGAFLSMPYFDLPYNIMVMVVLARRWVETRAWEREQPVPLLESLGFGRSKKEAMAQKPENPSLPNTVK
jgi:probable O-glycosylation ligase (exosortase A-associated)